MTERNRQYAQSLRAIADFYDAHPEVTAPADDTLYNGTMDEKADAQNLVRALGHCEKEYDESLFKIIGTFGNIKVRFVFYRENVCTKRVVGTKIVPAHIIPAREEQEVPEREEEIVEWDCAPLMAGDAVVAPS